MARFSGSPRQIGVLFINGDPGPAVVLDASEIPSTDGDVQTDIDVLQPITTEAELAARFSLVGSAYQIDAPMQLGPPALDLTASGRTLNVVAPFGAIRGFVGCTIIGASASPLITGEAPMRDVAVLNVGSGDDIDITASNVYTLEGVSLLGNSAGRISNVAQSLVLTRFAINPQSPNATGLRYEGSVFAVLLSAAIAISPGGTDYTAITIPAGTTYSATQFTDFLFVAANVADAFLFIDPAATISPTDVVAITRGNIFQAVGSLFASGSIDETDARVSSSNHINSASSAYRGNPMFDGGGVPIMLVHGIGTDVVPSQNAGPTAVLTAGANDERFTLVINGVQDWYLEYVGRINDVTGRVVLQATVAKAGGSDRPFTMTAQIDVGGTGTWVDIAGATGEVEIRITPQTISAEASVVVSQGDRLRLRADSADTTTSSISRYTLGFTGSP